MKSLLCFASYWGLFIIAPTAAAYSIVPGGWKDPIAIILFFCLLVIGEHALRQWARLWNVR